MEPLLLRADREHSEDRERSEDREPLLEHRQGGDAHGERLHADESGDPAEHDADFASDEAPASASQPVVHLTLPRLLTPARSSLRIAARRKKALVFMDPSEVWAFEADARLTFAHSAHGRLDIDVPLAEIEASVLGASFVRVHRSWLANLALVKALEHTPGETLLFVGAKMGERSGIRVPVSRDRLRPVRDLLLAGAIGVRKRETSA